MRRWCFSCFVLFFQSGLSKISYLLQLSLCSSISPGKLLSKHRSLFIFVSSRLLLEDVYILHRPTVWNDLRISTIGEP